MKEIQKRKTVQAVGQRNLDNPALEKTSKKTSLLWIWVSAALIVAAFAASLVVLVNSPRKTPDYSMADIPIIVEKGGEVWLLGGGNALSLGNNVSYMEPPYKQGKQGLLRGVVSFNNRYVYYMQDYQHNTGEGTLMRVRADATEAPVKVAEGVCTAKVSIDGECILYMTEITDGMGKLWLYRSGKRQVIADMVDYKSFGFSNCENEFYYYTKTGDDYTLYVFYNGQAEEVAKTALPAEYQWVVTDHNGRAIYPEVNADGSVDAYYSYLDGQSSYLSDDIIFVMMFADTASYLYTEKDDEDVTLYLKKPKQEPICIYEDEGWVRPIKIPYLGVTERNRCILATDIWDEAALFEFDIQLESLTLIEDDICARFITVNEEQSCIAFIKDDQTYIVQKEDGLWTKPEQIGEYAAEQMFFDKSLFYWLDQDKSFWQYDQDTKERKLLMEDTALFVVSDAVPYVLTGRGWVYRVSGDKPVLLCENAFMPVWVEVSYKWASENGRGSHYTHEMANPLRATRGGICVFTKDEGVIFFATEQTKAKELIQGKATQLYPPSLIGRYMFEAVSVHSIPYEVLAEEDEDALRELYEDAHYYADVLLGKFKDGASPNGSPEENMALAREIANREYAPVDAVEIAEWFDDTFSIIGYCLENEKDESDVNTALSNIAYATYYYERYMCMSDL